MTCPAVGWIVSSLHGYRLEKGSGLWGLSSIIFSFLEEIERATNSRSTPYPTASRDTGGGATRTRGTHAAPTTTATLLLLCSERHRTKQPTNERTTLQPLVAYCAACCTSHSFVFGIHDKCSSNLEKIENTKGVPSYIRAAATAAGGQVVDIFGLNGSNGSRASRCYRGGGPTLPSDLHYRTRREILTLLLLFGLALHK